MKGPPPWAGQPGPEPETTPDGSQIVYKNGRPYLIEDGVAYVYLSPEEEQARLERFLRGEPRRGQGRVSLDWDVWRS